MMSDTPLITRSRIAIGLSACCAIAVPLLLLNVQTPPVDEPPSIGHQPFALSSPEEPADALAAPLFNPDRTAPSDDTDGNMTADAGSAANSGQPLILVGLIVGGKAAPMALIRSGDGETALVHARDVVDGWQVTDISASGTTISKGSEQQRLSLDYGNKPDAAQAAPSALPNLSESRAGK